MAMDARHHRPDRRQVYVVVGVEGRLIGGAEAVVAVRARLRSRLHDPVGMFRQRPRHPGTAGPLRRPPLGVVRLVALAGRDRRVGRRLGRLAEPGFQLLDTLGGRRDLFRLLGDHVRLGQHQGDQIIVAKLPKRVAIHRI